MSTPIANPAAIEPVTDAAGRDANKRSAELLETLEAIILNDGFARLSVSDMAARLGCSKRTIYSLAPTKNDLVLQIVEGFFAGIRSEARQAMGQVEDPREQLFEYLQVGVRAAQRLGAVAIADIDRWEPARRVWQNHVRLRVDGLTELIEGGIAHGTFRDVNPKLVAELAFASINRLREPDFYRSTDISISEAFEEFYRMLLDSLVISR
jgi:AcrR family transcriptional regulator